MMLPFRQKFPHRDDRVSINFTRHVLFVTYRLMLLMCLTWYDFNIHIIICLRPCQQCLDSALIMRPSCRPGVLFERFGSIMSRLYRDVLAVIIDIESSLHAVITYAFMDDEDEHFWFWFSLLFSSICIWYINFLMHFIFLFDMLNA